MKWGVKAVTETETAFEVSFGAETATEFRSVPTSNITEDGTTGHNTYHFLLDFYMALSLIVSALQSTVCQNDLVGRL